MAKMSMPPTYMEIRLFMKLPWMVNLMDSLFFFAKWNWTKFLKKSFAGNTKIVKVLIENDADVSIENDRGKTPIDVTADQGRDQILKMLLKVQKEEFEDRQLRVNHLKKALLWNAFQFLN